MHICACACTHAHAHIRYRRGKKKVPIIPAEFKHHIYCKQYSCTKNCTKVTLKLRPSKLEDLSCIFYILFHLIFLNLKFPTLLFYIRICRTSDILDLYTQRCSFVVKQVFLWKKEKRWVIYKSDRRNIAEIKSWKSKGDCSKRWELFIKNIEYIHTDKAGEKWNEIFVQMKSSIAVLHFTFGFSKKISRHSCVVKNLTWQSCGIRPSPSAQYLGQVHTHIRTRRRK